ncbi:hypothetical protein DFH08DRAFT_1075008 [Mycena albidolilacea]|uniref:Uncharacterized protein n=1 Tax=Mycena albidolilacea TaxID=1033008 RepID=A0AAD7AIW1_9AGAR|nr:hypothetical protein DFH08DRAFT_1075008 [Mycena albidolilacea]
MSAPLHKPLLLPGIAPHLFQTRLARRPFKTLNMPESDTSMSSDYAGRRAAEALVEAQAAQIVHLQGTVDSLTSQVHTTTNLHHNAQRQLQQATLHLGIIIAVYAEKNEHSLEGALVAAREFWKEMMDCGSAPVSSAPSVPRST